MWQNTNPIERPPPPKKPSPPPPPPKAEPIWYNCTVAVETHSSSKELDDLMQVSDATFLKLQKVLLLFYSMEGKYLRTQLYRFVKGPRRI